MSVLSPEPNKERLPAVLHFCSYIEHLNIPEDLKQAMNKAKVLRVEIKKAARSWQIYLQLDRLVKKSHLDILAGEIIREIPEVKGIGFSLRYCIPDLGPADMLKEYWDEIVYYLVYKHPVLSGVLAQVTKKYHQQTLKLFVNSQVGAELLDQRRVPGLISELLKDEFGLEVRVSVHVLEEDRCEQEEWVSRQEAEYVKELIAQNTGNSKPRQEESGGISNGQKPARTGFRRKKSGAPEPGALLGRVIKDDPVPIELITEEEKSIVIRGGISSIDIRPLKSGRTLVSFDVTDLTDSITVKYFEDEKDAGRVSGTLKKGAWVKVRGPLQHDKFSQELTIMAWDINLAQFEPRSDQAPEKRVELHLHTKMSAMDGITGIGEAVATAAAWGHPAVAITDHGVVQAYPDAYEAGKKHGIKIIYGIEGYLVNDGEPIVVRSHPGNLQEIEFVVFDLETTGLSPNVNEIIEIGAVKLKNGLITDRFARFIRPRNGIPVEIQRLTGILPEMVADAGGIDVVLPEFMEFAGDAVLVAHNAGFDTGFLSVNLAHLNGGILTNPVLDTLGLARALVPKLKKHKLKNLAAEFGVPLENHHRAVDDAEATAAIFLRLLEQLQPREINRLDEVNRLVKHINLDKLRTNHILILVKNETGLRNLYELVTLSHTKHYYRHPRIPRSELIKRREGLLIGSACEAGELISSYLDGADRVKLERIASFYDFLEIQPSGNNEFLIRQGRVGGIEFLQDMNRNIVDIGSRLDKPVVATCDVHFLDPADSLYRKVLMAGQGFEDADNQAPLYFRTTDEMLEEFSYLEAETAREVVITNPRQIADLIEEIKPMPDDFFPPKIDGAEEQIKGMTWDRVKSIYGETLPEIVQKRVEKELNSIINNGFAVLYLIAHKLVKKSNADGYLVGSRGSVGSSFVATMTGITEVNPLPPHYICPDCRHSEFITDGSYGSGADLPDKNCPDCGTKYKKDGFDIPFEVFLGFEGDKVPDIDLNFSGEYQPVAFKYTEELFGEGHAFRAGTIGTIAEKTAYGFIRKYLDERGLTKRKAETDRLVTGCSGVKRTTGQHPGGIMVIPRDMNIHDFTPLQYPADDKKSGVLTTHFDYHSISGRIVKLDILGHDDPTVIKMLEDLTGIDAKTIPLDEPETMKIFSAVEVLGVTPEQIGSNVGSFAIPEFGTKFVRQMLEDTEPKTFSELVRISGFSHGTDVWLNNAQDLIREGICKLSEAISARDDIMIYLIHRGLEPRRAFKIMEAVRKGKGVKPEDEEYMREFDVPEWYIESCKKIKYMFPKAHAVAYVMMAYRIAYFKVHYQEAFYATYFTVRADEFDADIVVQGPSGIRQEIHEIEAKGNDASTKEKNMLTILEVALEMYERGIKMLRVSLGESQAARFLITDEGILPPFAALQGLGETAARNIVKARGDKPFTSVEDLRVRSKLSKTVVEIMQNHGCLKELPETDQMALF
ncbi:PolC-type DNA polymerase III [Phosphitispora fastidiosa]|uniref:PolC-type DNA polymerase III n=1 Tax=Phosphitispora fastidiosa TaxID=2837202 RepID=UPI0022B18FC3|nr:PolC-type DNA polymerase III [Phosphitispora fastidiosa]MBU7008314.1 DNA polymerase-3 subunit alpha (Gram-positive type) [Phosphitispora fastidiosa]